jgi:hypothetical protein
MAGRQFDWLKHLGISGDVQGETEDKQKWSVSSVG